MRLRLASESDAAEIARIYAPIVRDTPISFEVDPPTADELALRIVETTRRFPWLIAVDGAGVAGYAYATAHRARAAYRWCCEVSAYVDERARRRGVGRAVYVALFRILERQGYRNAYAGIALPNEASVALHESVGFRPVGVYRGIGFKAGAWHDVGWWERDLARRDREPSEPVPFAELRDSPELLESLAAASELIRPSG